MSCSIERNNQGKIVGVKTPQGEVSELFNNIHSNIFLADADLSVTLLNKVYTDEMDQKYGVGKNNTYDNGEPKLFYQTEDGSTFDNLEGAIISGKGDNFSMGVKDPETNIFTPIANFSTISSPRVELLNNQVKEGILSAERVLGEDGVTRYQGKGEFEESRHAMAKAFKFNAMIDAGIGNVRIKKNGEIEIDFPTSQVIAIKDGKKETVTIEEVFDKDYDNRAELLSEYYRKTIRPLVSKEKPKPVLNVKATIQSLYSFLENIGFNKITLENYRKNYNNRYGEDPDINALTDIANRVVAFKEGEIPLDQLTEEVAHIAIEAYSDQNSIVSALANVHLSPEYNQHAAYYRQKYSPFYEGFELEEQVRKEILGKILGKELQNRFRTQATNEDQSYLFSKIREIWDAFVKYIQGTVKGYHVEELQRLSKKIADSIFANDINEFGNELEGNKNFFYSAMSKESQRIEIKLQKARKLVYDLFQATGQKKHSAHQLDKITDLMVEADVVSSVNTIIGIAEKQVGIIESNIKESEKTGEPLSVRDLNIFNTLSLNLIPTVNAIASDLKKLMDSGDIKSDANKEIVKGFIKTIAEISSRKDVLQPEVDKDMERIVMEIVDKSYGDSANLSDEQRKIEMAKIQGDIKDLGLFATYLGLQTHSENPILQLISQKIVELQTVVNNEFLERTQKDLDDIYKNGWDKFQGNLVKKINGLKTHFFSGPINWARIKQEEDAETLRLLTDKTLNLTGKTEEQIKLALKKSSVRDIINNAEKFKIYTDEFSKFKEKVQEKPYTEKYYQDRDERYNRANVSEFTRTTISNFNSRSFEILKPYRNKLDGTIDKSRLTEGEKKELADLKKDREVEKSPYSVFGELKEGIRVVSVGEMTLAERTTYEKSLGLKSDFLDNYKGDIVTLRPGVDIEDLSDEARTSLDMNNLAMVYASEVKVGEKSITPTQSFLNQIAEIEARGESAYEWAMSNASIGLAPEYFDNLDTFVGYDQIAQKYIDTLENEVDRIAMQDKLNQYKELNRRRRNILKQNRQMSNQLEIDVNNMTPKIRETIVDLDERIKDLRDSMKLPSTLFTQVESTASNKELNEHYYKLLKESGLSEYEFAIKHMTTYNRQRTENFAYQIAGKLSGRRRFVDRNVDDFFKTLVDEGTITTDMSIEEVISKTQDEFAKRRVASYFQRYTPAGYQEAINALQSSGQGNTIISDLLDENKRAEVIRQNPALKYIEIRPDYSWSENVSNEDNINPNYKKGGFFVKPKKEYIDQEWFDRYGISLQSYLDLESEDLVTTLKATRNVEEFELWKKMIKLREDSINTYGDSEVVNKYQLVQQSSKNFEKAFGGGVVGSSRRKFANAKDFLADISRNRADEKQYGEQVEGEDLRQEGSDIDVRVVPKYYQTLLEDPEMITDNIIGAGLGDFKQALTYRERKRLELDVTALKWQLKKQDLISTGSSKRKKITKRGEVSNYLWKGSELIDHAFYGIKQTRSFKTTILGQDVDLTNFINAVQSFSVFANLAYSPFVDITGYTTGQINKLVDNQVEENYSKSSSSRAKGQAREYMANYGKDFGNVNKNTKANAIMEYFQILNPERRLGSTQFGKGARIFQKSAFLMSELSNLATIPQILFGTLNDYRYFNGKFVSHNEFVRLQKQDNPKIDKKGIDVAWDKIKDDSLFDNLTITERGVTYNSNFEAKYKNPKQAFEDITVKIVAKAQQTIQNVDGVLNEQSRVAAQRDIASNVFMQHKGWLLIALARKFKKRSFNIAADKMEEGHYITAANALIARFNSLRGGQSYMEYSEGLQDFEKRNLKRLKVELAGLGIIAALGYLMFSFDDDDDTWAENLAQLIYLRTLSEYNTSQLQGLPGVMIETAKSPVTSIETFKFFEPFSSVYSFTQEDSQGRNKGVKQFIKITPLKRIGQFQDLQGTIDNFRLYNEETLFGIGKW